MKFCIYTICFAFLFLTGCAKGVSQNPVEPSTKPTSKMVQKGEQRLKTDHFTLIWDAEETTLEEAKRVSSYAESAYTSIAKILESHIPEGSIGIRLEGDAGPQDVPTVSLETGEILLYRYLNQGADYEAALVHELVHALRRPLWIQKANLSNNPFLFVEEGFAELIASEAGFPSTGFPLYGTSIEIAAGQWLQRGEAIPMENLIKNHIPLSFQCLLQSYTLRFSFFLYLRETFGLSPLIELAYLEPALTLEDMTRILKTPVEELIRNWNSWALAKYEAVDQADSLAEAYRTHPVAKWFPVCPASMVEAK